MKKEKKLTVEITPALEDDWPAIKKLIEASPKTLVQDDLPNWNEFFIARHKSEVVGCSALVVYSKRLAELRSLVVAEQYKENGIGPRLIQECILKAQKAGVKDVLAISGDKDFFEKLNFSTFKDEKYALFRKTNPVEILHECVSCRNMLPIQQGMTYVRHDGFDGGSWACLPCVSNIIKSL